MTHQNHIGRTGSAEACHTLAAIQDVSLLVQCKENISLAMLP